LLLRFVLVASLALALGLPVPALAIPVFAHRYGVGCETCHTIVPELTAFGQAFADAGYRWPAPRATNATLPIAMKTNLAYTSGVDPSGLPKAVVDEVEFLIMAPVGKHLLFRYEQYAIDGGVPGKTRDAYVEYNSNPLAAYRGWRSATFDLQAGSFTLPLPNDPETMRPTANHYAVFDQTVGANPFNLFDDRIGLNARYGNRFAAINVVAAQGHDPQSGLPSNGLDTLITARVGPEALTLWGYQYSGTRPLGIVADRFRRQGVALTSVTGRAATSLLLQTGTDSSADGIGGAVVSSGGYLQEEWTFNRRLIGTVRYDGLNAPGAFARATTLSLSYRPYARARWTIEDVIATQPQTTHTLNLGWLFAY
jgi:hypothetical protein